MRVSPRKSPGGFGVGPDDKVFSIFDGNKFKISKDNKLSDGTFTLDASKTPPPWTRSRTR